MKTRPTLYLLRLFALATLLVMQSPLWAQMPKFQGKDPNTNEAEFALVTAIPKELCVGDVVTFTFKGKVNIEGWHLYSSRQDGNIAYNPTMLEIFEDESKGIKLKGKMSENHKAEEVNDEIMGGFIRSFHEKQVDFTQKLEITGPEVVLVGQLSAQTCTSEGMCKFLKLPIEWKVSAKVCGNGMVTPPGGDSLQAAAGDSTQALPSSFSFTPYDSSLSLSDNVGKQGVVLGAAYRNMEDGGVSSIGYPGQAQAYSKLVGRPILYYFTGIADVESRKMEAEVLKNPVIDSILRYRVVLTKLYLDDKGAAPAGLALSSGLPAKTIGEYYTDFEANHFGAGAVHPLFALEDADGKRYGESIGNTDVAQFSKWLRGVIGEYYTSAGRAEAAWLPKKASAAPVATAGESKEGDCTPMSLLLVFLKALAGGFVALLTPCVYPMIPMTVSFFVKQGEGAENKQRGLRNAVTYAVSIVLIYSVFGFIISAFLPADTMYSLGSGIIPNLLFFAIFFVFALSFFGLFEITLPSKWSTAANNKAGAGGLLGPFFMALTLVIVSFSCTGPILGTAVVGASSSSCPWSAFVAFLGFGIAFAIPFGMLALFPKLMDKLPQAGGWMNTVKVVFGFLELALCLKFLSNVDLELHWHILDRQIFLAIWVVIFVLLGAYFLGWILLPHDEKPERVSVPRLLFAVLSFSFVMYMVPGLWGGPLSALEGLIPPTTKSVGVRLLPHQVEGGGGGGTKTLNKEICESDRKFAFIAEDREAHGLCMFYDLEQAIAFAKEKNKPLFVDFTGHSCANCRKMENDVWPEEKIMKLLQNEFVTVSLYADEKHRFDTPKISPEGAKLRDVGSWVTDYQRRNYKLISQPYYVLMDHDESSLNAPRPYTPDVDAYHEFLKEGIAEFNKRHGITKSAPADEAPEE